MITPHDHITNHGGCKKCFIETQKFNITDIITISNKIHNEKYDYTNSIYKSLHEDMNIVCPIHGVFFQKPSVHIYAKSGCKKCSKYGFNPTKTSFFYIQELIHNGMVISYKFGITNDLSKRIKHQQRNSIYKHNYIFSFKNEDGEYILQLEKNIKNNMNCKFILKENMKDGYTETINPNEIDILENLIIEYLTK